jgi:hypothetical protein
MFSKYLIIKQIKSCIATITAPAQTYLFFNQIDANFNAWSLRFLPVLIVRKSRVQHSAVQTELTTTLTKTRKRIWQHTAKPTPTAQAHMVETNHVQV